MVLLLAAPHYPLVNDMAENNFEAMKFACGKDPELIAYIQKALYKLGYKWRSGSTDILYTHQDLCLFTLKTGKIYKRANATDGTISQEYRHSEAREINLKDTIAEAKYDAEIEEAYEAAQAEKSKE